MIALASTESRSFVANERGFYASFLDLRLKLRAAGADIVAVHHANNRVEVDWLPPGAGPKAVPCRSTIQRLASGSEPDGAADDLETASGVICLASWRERLGR